MAGQRGERARGNELGEICNTSAAPKKSNMNGKSMAYVGWVRIKHSHVCVCVCVHARVCVSVSVKIATVRGEEDVGRGGGGATAVG